MRKPLLGLGLLAVIGLLANISYQLDRMTWSDVDRQCWGLFQPADQQRFCQLSYYVQQNDKKIRADLLNGN